MPTALEFDLELWEAWFRESPAMKLCTKLDGTIVHANPAFCEWSGYTLAELKRMTWMDLSKAGPDLDADMAEMQLLTDGQARYTVTKTYVPKNDKPHWGKLTVARYPTSGAIQCCLCTWEPVKNGTAVAFNMAVEEIGKLTKQVSTVANEVKTLTAQTDQDKMAVIVGKLLSKHWKIVLVVCVTVFVGNNGLAFLQRTGIVPLPHFVPEPEPNASPQKHAEHDAAQKAAAEFIMQADGIDYGGQPATLTVSNRQGLKVQWRPKEQPIQWVRGEQEL